MDGIQKYMHSETIRILKIAMLNSIQIENTLLNHSDQKDDIIQINHNFQCHNNLLFIDILY